ncbi:MAG: TetR/AcrR family transcriptional regulator [Roseobacter sp.]
MARPRTFDMEDAIAKAAGVFWEKGYEDASLPDLLGGMQLTRGSLYKAFTDKRTLYFRVLEYYEENAVNRAVDILSDEAEPDGRQRILSLFGGIVRAVKSGDRRGCLLCTAAAGAEMHDPELAGRIGASLDRMKAAFEVAVSASPPHKDMSAEQKSLLAGALLAQYTGLRILARSGQLTRMLESSLGGIRMMLGSSPQDPPNAYPGTRYPI